MTHKTENNLENKARFMALYWEQKVWCNRFYKNALLDSDSFHSIHLDSNAYLSLKPLSSITDEDLKQLGTTSQNVILKDYTVSKGVEFYNYEIDYLRSKDYAVPWMGLSVEDLIEYGWIKLM